MALPTESDHRPTYIHSWIVTCPCGWSATDSTKAAAAKQYTNHRNSVLPSWVMYGDPRRHAKVERNRQIAERIESGESPTHVARDLGISVAIVREKAAKAEWNRRHVEFLRDSSVSPEPAGETP